MTLSFRSSLVAVCLLALAGLACSVGVSAPRLIPTAAPLHTAVPLSPAAGSPPRLKR